MTRPASALERNLGYRFRDEALLLAALTPPWLKQGPNNQRLEFLGDSVLALCVSLLVYREHPDWPEGSLTKLRGLMICADALHAWAEALGVELAAEPDLGSRKKSHATHRNALADAMEALLAAMYLDLEAQGEVPVPKVLALVERRFLAQIRSAYVGIWESRDSKTTLQERGAVLGLAPPAYELLEQSGPDHAPTFRVRATLGAFEAEASAGTVKRAQAEAARLLLGILPAAGKHPSGEGVKLHRHGP